MYLLLYQLTLDSKFVTISKYYAKLYDGYFKSEYIQ